jgi:hypothetical protein
MGFFYFIFPRCGGYGIIVGWEVSYILIEVGTIFIGLVVTRAEKMLLFGKGLKLST